ncbi:hypothetical protein [Hyalangium minutum]|uniref:PhnA-like protein n=1 Tax=Hyalangium minutum TaxID=394096 RepID=A0A085WC85_9BACT|nr:hypothetical protein [Hyalangium minutum]KFE65298.1 hypothetical protein DB31_1414 [Hyalangium minutum]
MVEIVEKPRVEAIPGVPFKLSWGAIFGGTFVALGVWILLYALGLALGFSSVDPNNPGSAKSAGIGTGIWSLIAPLIALFVGGLVAARTAGVVDKMGGALHGAVLWGLTTLVGVIVMGMALSSLLGAVFNVGKTAVEVTGAAISGAASPGSPARKIASAFGLNAEDALAPVNQRLRQEGKAPITTDQLQAATRDVLNTAIQQGRLDRELLVNAVAQNTALSLQDAEGIASRIEVQWNQAQNQVAQVGQQVQQEALKAADTTGRVFWGVFAALLFGLVSAILGATLGVSRRQRYYAEDTAVPPMGPRREVYP